MQSGVSRQQATELLQRLQSDGVKQPRRRAASGGSTGRADMRISHSTSGIRSLACCALRSDAMRGSSWRAICTWSCSGARTASNRLFDGTLLPLPHQLQLLCLLLPCRDRFLCETESVWVDSSSSRTDSDQPPPPSMTSGDAAKAVQRFGGEDATLCEASSDRSAQLDDCHVAMRTSDETGDVAHCHASESLPQMSAYSYCESEADLTLACLGEFAFDRKVAPVRSAGMQTGWR